MLLNDKVAFITGAASGIGKEIALEFAREGARVAIADLAMDAASTSADDIRKEGGTAMALAVDVAIEEQVEQAMADTVAAYGGIDILISNAGIQIISPVVELTLDQWKKVLAIHLDGAFLTTRAAMREMIRAGHGGTVIYMGSAHSHEASPLKAPYVTAKHGLLGLARTVAREGVKDNIRAYVICPGFVRTPLVERQIPEQSKKLGISEEEVIKNVMLKETIDGEFTTTEDIARIALFLASFPSSALTGQSIIASHGWHMQ
ncbi:MAG: 3-hydroxybutyrate dehydrogenase [Pseudomonadota bacterium]